MSRILDIQKKSNQWMANFTDNVIRIIEGNEAQIVAYNKSQMLRSVDANDNPLINKKTGSANLSPAYAKRKKKSKPNLFDTSEFQADMFLTMPTEKEYIITSGSMKRGFLEENYGKIFGVSPSNQGKAKAINDAAIINDYMKEVFQ